MRSHTVALLALCLAALQLAVLAAPLQHFSGLLGRSLGSRPSLGHSRHLHLARRSASPVAQWPRSQLISAQFQPEPSEYKNKRFVTRSDIKSSSDNKKRSDNNFVKPATSSSGPKVNPKHHSNFSKRDSNCTKRSDSDFSLKGDAMAASYYPDWNGNNFPPEKVDYSLFDLIYFAFGIPDENFNIYFTQSNSVELMQRVVKNAHMHGTKVVLSIGGWTGSQHFSKASATPDSRETFATNLANLVSKYNLDGIDLDWEYPGGPGATNDYDSADSQNLAALLANIRNKVGSKKLITMAVSVNPFLGPDGSPLSDVSAQAKYLDHILIMNYDVWGATDNPGANAPLSNACGDSQQPAASARAAIAAWKKAKMPASKITLGLPAYGYVSWSGNSKLVHKRDHIQEEPPRYKTYMEYWQAGRREQDARRLAHSTGQDVANSTSSSPALVKRAGDGDISAFAQSQIPWDQLISLGALTKNNKGAYVAANGFTRAWDDCSNTPYLYSQDKWQVVTYDDPTSIALKARYARGQKIGGFAFWDMTTDTSYTLMKAARAGWSIPDR